MKPSPNLLKTALLAVAVGLSAAASAQDASQAPILGSWTGPTCPMDLPGTQVMVEDTSKGVQFTFTNPTADTDALRARVHSMAAVMTNPPASISLSQGGVQRQYGGQAAMIHQQPMLGEVKVKNVHKGARLTVMPANMADMTMLRARLHVQGARLILGQCPLSMVAMLQPAVQTAPSSMGG